MSMITATTSYGKDKLQIASFFVDDKGVEYQEAGSIEVQVSSLQNGGPRNPTAIGGIGDAGRTQKFVMFFDEIFTVQEFDITESFKLNQPLVVSRSHDYQLAKTWLGCPTELCFDSRLDYAYIEDRNIVLGRGQFFWKISRVTRYIKLYNGNVTDDVLIVNGDRLVIYDGSVTRAKMNESRALDKIFRGALYRHVDAAFELNGEYVLSIGSNAQIFKLVHSGSKFPLFKLDRNRSLSYLFPLAPSSGFDAAANLEDNNLVLFNNNFYYEYHPSKGLSSPRLIQGNLIVCSNSYYRSSNASKQLNISSYQDFAAYRTQFMEISSSLATTQTTETMQSATKAKTVSTTTLITTTVSRTKFTKNRSSRKHLQIAALGLLISIAIFATLLLIAVRLYLKASASSNSADNENDTSDEISLLSVS
ncbi:hypothetical protein HDE_13195 [Halotydeus destructor]|nr:hypothetical protein HDE_13195 [Halotydeus destructor]